MGSAGGTQDEARLPEPDRLVSRHHLPVRGDHGFELGRAHLRRDRRQRLHLPLPVARPGTPRRRRARRASMIRKPQKAERASALRRTAEASIDVGERAGEVARKIALACQAIVACGLMAIFAYGALGEPTWPLRI